MDLDELRQEIDDCDRRLVELLNERAEIVLKIGEWKREQGRAIYDPSREQAVLKRISEANHGPLPDECLYAIYRELMSASIALEQGREALAVPGWITSPTSAGTNRLIRDGAKIVTCVEDVVEEFSPQVQALLSAAPSSRGEEEALAPEDSVDLVCRQPG